VQAHYDAALASLREIQTEHGEKLTMIGAKINASYREMQKAIEVAIESVRAGKVPPILTVWTRDGKPVGG
jgi:hypothetical protein